jgi:hypothetical protein
MGAKNLKRKQEDLRRKKKTLFKKVYEFGRDYNINLVLIIHHNGRYFTYRSVDQVLICRFRAWQCCRPDNVAPDNVAARQFAYSKTPA